MKLGQPPINHTDSSNQAALWLCSNYHLDQFPDGPNMVRNAQTQLVSEN